MNTGGHETTMEKAINNALQNASTMNAEQIAQTIFTFIISLQVQYGKTTISGILVGNHHATQKKEWLSQSHYFGSLSPYTEENVVSIITQLLEQGYLHLVNVGFDFPMEVIEVTESGKAFLDNPTVLKLNLPPVYSTDFKEATELASAGITEEMIREYYKIKRQLDELAQKEENLKAHIKYCMMQHKINRVNDNKVELLLREVERVLYPKAEVERYVPQDLLAKIKKVQKILVLTIKNLPRTDY